MTLKHGNIFDYMEKHIQYAVLKNSYEIGKIIIMCDEAQIKNLEQDVKHYKILCQSYEEELIKKNQAIKALQNEVQSLKESKN